MAVQLLFLFLASNLASVWGMTGAGWIMRLTTREAGVHYPSSFAVLMNAHAMLESFLFTTVGSFLIPLSLVRIYAPVTGSPGTGAAALSRVRRAYLPTFCSLLVNVALLLGWLAIFPLGPNKWIHVFLSGGLGDLAGWCVGALVSFLLGAVFLYVPIRGVATGASFRDAFVGGIREGFRALGPTLFIILVFAWPTLIFLAPVQLRPMIFVNKFRPEIIAILIAAAAIVNSFVNYLIYSAAARLHWLGARKEG
mgnify:CR=1 FL=1